MSSPTISRRSSKTPPPSPDSIYACVAAARVRLQNAGIASDEAELDARLLAEHLLSWDTAHYFASGHGQAPPGFSARFEVLIGRRVRREPLAYIIGRQEFWGLAFEVSPAVLIPRPESELVVEAALEVAGTREQSLSVADACTGSGCLGIALAYERPQARIIATDLSDRAIEVARRNAARHGVEERIEFVRIDLLETLDGPFDLIVSNPPYVPEGDRARLEPEVRDHEPAVALFAGHDGLAVIRRLLEQARSRLKPGATLIFEIGFGQAAPVTELISGAPGLKMAALRRDLQGIPRTVIVRRY
jgi:release factor glutamine methyltransferase